MSTTDLPDDALFHFDDDRESFEDLARQNGVDTWSARELMEALEYASWSSFKNVVNRAQKAVISCGHDAQDHFTKETDTDGVEDFRLTRYACYMVVMGASSSKPRVAIAQSYFATIAEALQKVVSGSDDVERLLIRSEIVDENKQLAGVAKAAGASGPLDYALFQDAGYVGLYNMRRADLARHKGLGDREGKRIMDFMGSRELAANLFRITETKAKIEAEGITGNRSLQAAHKSVGRRVRKTMISNTGEHPEDLDTAPDIKKVKSDLKRTGKKIDSVERPKRSD